MDDIAKHVANCDAEGAVDFKISSAKSEADRRKHRSNYWYICDILCQEIITRNLKPARFLRSWAVFSTFDRLSAGQRRAGGLSSSVFLGKKYLQMIESIVY
jgi:hypothetical protein